MTVNELIEMLEKSQSDKIQVAVVTDETFGKLDICSARQEGSTFIIAASGM